MLVYHDGEWRDLPPSIFIQRDFEWAGEVRASDSIQFINGLEASRTSQLVGPLRIDAITQGSITSNIPEGAESVSWRAMVRSTSGRTLEGTGGGTHMSFSGLLNQQGRAPRLPDDEEWYEDGQSFLALNPTRSQLTIYLLFSGYTGDWWEIRDFQVTFDNDPWPGYWDGDSSSTQEWAQFTARITT